LSGLRRAASFRAQLAVVECAPVGSSQPMPGGTLSAGRLDEDDIAAIDAGIGVALNNDIVTARQVANDVDLDGRAGVVDVVVVADAEAEAGAAGYCIEIRVG
jgi:hypothetical protein